MKILAWIDKGLNFFKGVSKVAKTTSSAIKYLELFKDECIEIWSKDATNKNKESDQVDSNPVSTPTIDLPTVEEPKEDTSSEGSEEQEPG